MMRSWGWSKAVDTYGGSNVRQHNSMYAERQLQSKAAPIKIAVRGRIMAHRLYVLSTKSGYCTIYTLCHGSVRHSAVILATEQGCDKPNISTNIGHLAEQTLTLYGCSMPAL